MTMIVNAPTYEDMPPVYLPLATRPDVPTGDEHGPANAILADVLELSRAWHDALATIGNQHIDAAPVSSRHVLDLEAAISRAVLDWIVAWPS
jgi:hypothetical protein